MYNLTHIALFLGASLHCCKKWHSMFYWMNVRLDLFETLSNVYIDTFQRTIGKNHEVERCHLSQAASTTVGSHLSKLLSVISAPLLHETLLLMLHLLISKLPIIHNLFFLQNDSWLYLIQHTKSKAWASQQL